MPTNQPSAENVERANTFYHLLISTTAATVPDDATDADIDAHIIRAWALKLDEAERRGAVRELRELVNDEDWIYPDVIKCILNRANELEAAATKETEGEQGR